MKKITCIVCPRGCTLTVKQEGDTLTVSGNACPRGEKHAVSEVLNPVRSLTTSLYVSNREDTAVSVKTAAPVPKGQMLPLMEQLRKIQVAAPIRMGQVLIRDVCGTDIIATKEIS